MVEESIATGPALEIRGLRISRGGRVVVPDLDLEVPRGEPFAIAGASGSGKTTLLMAVAGLAKPDHGEILLAGQSLTGLSPQRRAELVGIVFQEYHLFPHLSAIENVCLAPSLHGDADYEQAAARLFQELGLQRLEARAPHELSGGQRQRVAIARTLILRPKVVLFDEPSAALDPTTTAELAVLLRRLSSDVQVIVVSHDMPFLRACCVAGVRMVAGRTESGTIQEISGHE